MFFELRQYHIRPGQRDNWVKCMEEEIIPFQVKMGMVILGSFVGEEDESVYVWIRRFESEAERKRLYDAVYQRDYGKNEISTRVPTMIDREQINVTRLVATPHSVIQLPTISATGLLRNTCPGSAPSCARSRSGW